MRATWRKVMFWALPGSGRTREPSGGKGDLGARPPEMYIHTAAGCDTRPLPSHDRDARGGGGEAAAVARQRGGAAGPSSGFAKAGGLRASFDGPG